MNRVAKQLIRHIPLTKEIMDTVVRSGEGAGWQSIVEHIALLDPAQLGILAACGLPYNGSAIGRTTMYQIHCGSYLGKYEGGLQLLQTLAATAVAAHINDILNPRSQPEQEG
jgi:hypothetical protein